VIFARKEDRFPPTFLVKNPYAHARRMPGNPRAIVLLTAYLILAGNAVFPEDGVQPPGRWLHDGSWQPRNLHALYERATVENHPGGGGYRTPEEVLSIDWEPEVPLADTTGMNAFYGDIIEDSQGRVHLVVINFVGDVPLYLRSTDAGDTWEPGRYIWDESGPGAVFYQLFANGDTLTMPFSGNQIFRSTYSSDAGDSWSGWGYPFWQGTACSSARLGDTIYSAVALRPWSRVYYTENYGVTWHDELPAIPMEYDYVDSYALAASKGGGLLSLLVSPGQEVFFSRFDFADSAWTFPESLSANPDRSSFNPLARAWGDSNLIALWLDYEHSPYAWTGDLLYRLSADGGRTWGDIRQATESHLAHDRDLAVRHDSLFLVYSEQVPPYGDGTEEVFFRLSPDGGGSWEEPVRLTEALNLSIYPQVAVAGDRVHVSWCDARAVTWPRNNKAPYYRRGILRGPDGIEDEEPIRPGALTLMAYPNPFNESTNIMISNRKGGELRLSIIDIQGREIRQFYANSSQGGEAQINWDATDASGKKVSNGIYFAKAAAPQGKSSIKILLLR
jgi:hypothetical protein